MDRRRHEGMSQAVHGQKRRIPGCIAMIVDERRAGQGGAGGRFDRVDGDVLPVDLVAHVGKGQAGEIAAAAGAAHDHVRAFADQGKLLLGLQADDGLVQHDVVEHAAQRVAGLTAGVGHGGLDGFADGDAQAARGLRIFFQGIAAGLGFVAGAGHAGSAPGLHHGLAVGLLVEADPDHVNLAFQAELRTGEGEGAAPLAGAGLGGHALDPEDFVVVGLGHGGVGFVATGRAAPLVFVVDPGRGLKRLFQPAGAHQGGWAPEAQHVQYRFGDVDPALRAHLLLDQVHGKNRRQVLGRHRRPVGPKRGIERNIRQDIVPLPGHLPEGQINFTIVHSKASLLIGATAGIKMITPICQGAASVLDDLSNPGGFVVR